MKSFKEAKLNFGEQIEQSRKETTAKIDVEFYNWFIKKHAGRAKSYEVTSMEGALSGQKISLSKSAPNMGSRTYTAKLFGDYVMVLDDNAGVGQNIEKFYNISS